MSYSKAKTCLDRRAHNGATQLIAIGLGISRSHSDGLVGAATPHPGATTPPYVKRALRLSPFRLAIQASLIPCLWAGVRQKQAQLSMHTR